MSAQNRNSGVRNLRAMFETQSAASSPEPRNRSPGNADDRPVSTNKIRASFVAVGPSTPLAKDLGSNKGTSDSADTTAGHRRESFSISNEVGEDTIAELKKVVTEEKEERKNSDAVAEVVPEQAVASRESSQPAPPVRETSPEEMPNLGSIMKGADFPEPQALEAEETKAEEPATQAPAIEPAIESVPSIPDEPQAQEPIEPEVAKETEAKVEEPTSAGAEMEPLAEEAKAEAEAEKTPLAEPESAKEEVSKVEESVAEPESQPEPLPTPAAAPEPTSEPSPPEVGETPAANPDKLVSGAQEEVTLKPADPKDEIAVSGGDALPPPVEDLSSAGNAKSVPEASKAASSTSSKPKTNGVTSHATTNGKTATKKPPAISTTKVSSTKGSSAKSPLPKSPGPARLPKTPTTPKVAPTTLAKKSPAPSKEPAKAPHPAQSSKSQPLVPAIKSQPPTASTKAHPPAASAKAHPVASTTKSHPPTAASKPHTPAPAAKTSRSSLKPSTASAAPAAATAGAPAQAKTPVADQKKPVTSRTAAPAPPKDVTKTSPGGFKKPRPKSPTRPVRLPSHLTAPTASSAAKHDEDAASKLGRKPSTTSRPAALKTNPPARNSHSRASLAPNTVPGKRPDSRASTKGAPDEGFLARMMRPTAASAKKTHEKPASPPRKGASSKALIKPKSGHESTISKGKKKVEEVASKAKEALTTNGHDLGSQKEDDSSLVEPEAPNDASTKASDETVHPERESTPSEQVESSAVELQTPNFGEGQAIR